MVDAASRLRAVVSRARERGGTVAVLGIGNEMLGDDAVGCLVARDLEGLEAHGLFAVAAGIAVENAGALVCRHRPRLVIVVDAATLPGRAAWALVPAARLDTFCHSTHSVPLPLLLAAWRQDGPRLVARFVGVRAHDSRFGAPLSPAIERARAEIVAAVRRGLHLPE